MLRKIINRFLLLIAMTILNGIAFADGGPTLHQVYQASQAGKLDEAQGMMEKVLNEHPNSGKAHFVEAEILAKQGRLASAEMELNTAERLDPGLSFAKPQSVKELKSRIAAAHQSQSTMNSVLAKTASDFPWGLLLLGIGSIAVITMVMRAITSRNAVTSAGSYQIGPSGGAGQSPAAGQAYAGGGVAPTAAAGGGIGSSIVSGLATGVAVGAGVVAGEALAHHFMDGNRSGTNAVSPIADSWDSSSNNMGGADFGIADNSSWDDNSSLADSGGVGGGDDWS
ncbi:tetratricopeptide repeat protein [Sulfuricella denitrificans]|nr:tetratricopeptide repeat protein [Sulfuricella denitrificans]